MATTCSCCGDTFDLTVQLRSHPEIHICHWCLEGLERQRDGQLRVQGWTASGFEPIFRVADVARATEHYASMGFSIERHDETYAFARRDRGLTIHLTLSEGDEIPGAGALYVHCDDAAQLADEWRRADLEVSGPVDEDYGKREGSHVDPDGNLIRFGSPIRD
jgi:catechol 2,3-dioxygenase-like lactoylglutathione lyase family enzyme